MQHVIFARDRKRKKLHLKSFVFFTALLSLFIGIILVLKNQSVIVEEEEHHHDFQALNLETNKNHNNFPLSNNAPMHLSSGEIGIITQNDDEKTVNDNVTVDENATSYDDELKDKDDEVETTTDVPLSEEAENILANVLEVADQAMRINAQFSHTVVSGDSLGDILEQSGLDKEVANQLTHQYPELAKLKVGQQFHWILDKTDNLDRLSWLVSEKEEQIFTATDSGKFNRQIMAKQGIWKQEVLKGEIAGSFSTSLKKLGLSQRQISQLDKGLQWQIQMTKLQKGDKFAILVKREYVNDVATELGQIEAIHILTQNKSYYAILAENGRYYNRHGETIGKGFSRYPLQYPARISSPFNPKRYHPITKKISPHRGVDFAIPVGTPIIAPSDGVIEKVAYQESGAGRYIILKHSKEYTTVYMHLSKTLVKPGQAVKKGERIALSGNTGRSTGPHLHYEFHINDRPVNPMTVKLPNTDAGMPEKERKTFLHKAKLVEEKLRF